jgi:ABC-type phosphate/phosphonate transport system permease subunit
LFHGRDACADTLGVVDYCAFSRRVKNNKIEKLRANYANNPMLVRFDSLPQSWQNLLVRKFGEPKRMVTFE